MEAIAALGLASNILQQIDFTAKLISEVANFVHSSGDAVPENLRIATLVQENRILIDTILADTATKNAEDKALHRAAKTCGDRAADLLHLLDSLVVRTQSHGWTRKIKRASIAAKSYLKRDEVGARRADLEQAHAQLNTLLLHFIRSNHISTFKELRAEVASIDSTVALLASKQDLEKSSARKERRWTVRSKASISDRIFKTQLKKGHWKPLIKHGWSHR